MKEMLDGFDFTRNEDFLNNQKHVLFVEADEALQDRDLGRCITAIDRIYALFDDETDALC